MKDIQGLVNLMPFNSFDELQQRTSKDLLSDKRKSIYNLLKTNNYDHIDELLEDLGPKNNKKAVVKTLKRLKSQLINKLFFIDISKRSSTAAQKRKIEGYKKFAAVKILEQWDEISSFNSLAEELIRHASKNEMPDLVMLMSERMEFYYSFIDFNKKKAKYYAQSYEESLRALQIRRNVSNHYYHFVRLFIGGKQVYSRSYLDGFQAEMDKLVEIQREFPTGFVTDRVYSTLWFYYTLRQEYDRLLDICDKAMDYFGKHQSIDKLFMYEMRKGVSFLYLQDYDNARHYLHGLNKYPLTPGMLHWNSTKSYQFMLEMILAEYQRAADILIYVVTDTGIKNLPDIWLQQWNIRSAYIHFLARIDLVDLERFGKKRVPYFRLGKFLNDVPQYSKDKRGLNISIIIAQFLILLTDKKYDQIADRIEALNKYSYRHLKNDYRLRSNCFIRMLIQLPRANYHPIRAERYAKRYYDKLRTTQMNLNEFSNEIEIIPYEQLWELILGLLAKRLRIVRS